TALEQIWLRPTAEVNGIIGGYTGEGSKTVLPSKASAKLTFRLVAGQNPTKIRKAFRAFIRRHLPKDCTAEFHNQTADNHGVSVSADSIWVAAARKALKDEWGRKPVIGGEGGSIPVVGAFARYLGADSLLVGFSRANDAVHSPNEKYDLDCFQRGARSWARLIAGLAEGAK
ncbi:MAG TPA: M20/M25/M40 family metallo-hydrolase, partial [Aestuariivirga sp.]|nr:M20/M25/M40 family metallo-hydrolase [Aestuariivirga sp.]